MQARERAGSERLWLGVGITALVAVGLVLLVLAVMGRGVGEGARPVVLTLAALAGGLCLLAAALRTRISAADRVSDLERERLARLDAERRAQEEAAARVELAEMRRRLAGDLAVERSLRQKILRARQAEREWERELRSQISRLQEQQKLKSDPNDLEALVLHMALLLTEAEKGLLLSRHDEDGDGDFDLVRSVGFENDPEHSALAQRFACLVLKRDEIVREDDPAEIDPRRRTPADEEIRNLVAVPLYMSDRFDGVVVAVNRDGGFSEMGDDVLLALGDQAGAALQNDRLRRRLQGSYEATVRVLAEAIEVKDPLIGDHAEALSGVVARVAARLEIEPAQRDIAVFGFLLRDVGKIGITERILLKPGPLTAEERDVVKLHSRVGYRLVQQVPELDQVALTVLHHHERVDGAGYPAGLRGDEIPIAARIVAVADALAAMLGDRPYSAALTVDEAIAELERCAGSQFDAEVAASFAEELRARPLNEGERRPLPDALEDRDLEIRRGVDERVLGQGAATSTDSLTLLYSLRYLHEAAEVESERAALEGNPFSVVLVDLVDLNEINRLEGYAAGDLALQRVARALQRAAVEVNGTACRASGRRLALIAPHADAATAERLVVELAAELANGPAARVAGATWQPGDSGEDVLDRGQEALALPARAALRLAPAPPPLD